MVGLSSNQTTSLPYFVSFAENVRFGRWPQSKSREVTELTSLSNPSLPRLGTSAVGLLTYFASREFCEKLSKSLAQ